MRDARRDPAALQFCVAKSHGPGLRRLSASERDEAEAARTPRRIERQIHAHHGFDTRAHEHLFDLGCRRFVGQVAQVKRAVLGAGAASAASAWWSAAPGRRVSARATWPGGNTLTGLGRRCLKRTHGDGSPRLHGTVEHIARRVGFGFCRQAHEAEASWTPRGAVAWNADLDHSAARGFEELTEHLLGDRIWQARYEELASVVDRHLGPGSLVRYLLARVESPEGVNDIVSEKAVKRRDGGGRGTNGAETTGRPRKQRPRAAGVGGLEVPSPAREGTKFAHTGAKVFDARGA
jgi:hypothetical protein